MAKLKNSSFQEPITEGVKEAIDELPIIFRLAKIEIIETDHRKFYKYNVIDAYQDETPIPARSFYRPLFLLPI